MTLLCGSNLKMDFGTTTVSCSIGSNQERHLLAPNWAGDPRHEFHQISTNSLFKIKTNLERQISSIHHKVRHLVYTVSKLSRRPSRFFFRSRLRINREALADLTTTLWTKERARYNFE